MQHAKVPGTERKKEEGMRSNKRSAGFLHVLLVLVLTFIVGIGGIGTSYFSAENVYAASDELTIDDCVEILGSGPGYVYVHFDQDAVQAAGDEIVMRYVGPNQPCFEQAKRNRHYFLASYSLVDWDNNTDYNNIVGGYINWTWHTVGGRPITEDDPSQTITTDWFSMYPQRPHVRSTRSFWAQKYGDEYTDTKDGRSVGAYVFSNPDAIYGVKYASFLTVMGGRLEVSLKSDPDKRVTILKNDDLDFYAALSAADAGRTVEDTLGIDELENDPNPMGLLYIVGSKDTSEEIAAEISDTINANLSHIPHGYGFHPSGNSKWMITATTEEDETAATDTYRVFKSQIYINDALSYSYACPAYSTGRRTSFPADGYDFKVPALDMTKIKTSQEDNVGTIVLDTSECIMPVVQIGGETVNYELYLNYTDENGNVISKKAIKTAENTYEVSGVVPERDYDIYISLTGGNKFDSGKDVKAKPALYDIIYNGLGGTLKDGETATETNIEYTPADGTGKRSLKGKIFERAGYHFVGWSKNAKTDPRLDPADPNKEEPDSALLPAGEEIPQSWIAENKYGQETTLFAIWLAEGYDVTYVTKNEADGVPSAAMSGTDLVEKKAGEEYEYRAVYDQSFTTPIPDTPTGYDFAGWALAGDSKVKYAGGANVKNIAPANTDAITLYARYTAQDNLVTFDYNGADDAPSGGVENKYIKTGNTVGETAVPTKTGHVFNGWFENLGEENEKRYANADGTPVKTAKITKDTTLKAKFSPAKITVRYNAAGGTGTTGDNNKDIFYYGENRNLSANGFSKEGSTFLGWGTSPGEKTVAYVDKARADNIATTNANVTLYALWSEDPNGHTVEFIYGDDADNDTTLLNAPGGRVYKESDQYGELPNPTRDGYRFDGWYKSRLPWADPVESTDEVGNTTKLYAKWTAIEYKIDYYQEDGTTKIGSTDTVSVQNGRSESIRNNAPAKANCDFSGWNTVVDGTGLQYAPGANIPVEQLIEYDAEHSETTVLKLYAQYEPETYTISYTGLDGAVPAKIANDIKTYGEPINLAAAPAKTGYTFKHWKDDRSILPDKTYDAGALYTEDADVELTAVFEPADHVISLDPAGGNLPEGKDSYVTLKTGDNISNSLSSYSPTRNGYNFTGWNKVDSYGNLTPVTEEDLVGGLDDDFTLQAGWSPVAYTIKYDAGSAEATGEMADTEATYDEEVALAKNKFKRTGYDFMGWMIKGNPQDVIYANQAKVLNIVDKQHIGGDDEVTMVASWKPAGADYSIVFDLNDGGDSTTQIETQTMTVAANSSLAGLNTPTPTRTGYGFVGWRNNDNKDPFESDSTYKADTPVTTVSALWTQNKYTVEYYDTDGSTTGMPVDAKEYLYEDDFVMIQPATKTGYELKGWALSKTKAQAGAIDYQANDVENKLADGTDGNKVVKFYAVWSENKYTVTLDKNNGTPVQNYQIQTGEAYTLSETLTRKGYNFTGWFDLENNNRQFRNGETFDANRLTAEERADMAQTLTAGWDAHSYRIIFHNGDSTYHQGDFTDNTALEYGKNYELAPISTMGQGFQKPGWIFKGWATTATGAAVYKDNAVVNSLTDKNQGTVNLYAIWQPQTFSVSFVIDESTTINCEGKTGENYKVPDATAPEGYEFEGWFDKYGEPAYSMVPGETRTIGTENEVYIAHFKALETGDVTFNAGENGHFADQDPVTAFTGITTGTAIGTATDPADFAVPAIEAEDGWEFIGYKCSYGGLYDEDKYGDIAEILMGSDDIVLTAQYVKKGDTAIWFDYNGGTDADSADSKKFEGTADTAFDGTVPTTTREGYTFSKWKIGDDDLDVDTLKYPEEGMTVITAEWTANDNTVEFKPDDAAHGSVKPTTAVTVKTGEAVGDQSPEATADDKYDFSGYWLCSEDGHYYKTADIQNYVVKGGSDDPHKVTFTAQFTEKGKTAIVYDFNGGKAGDDVTQKWENNAGKAFNAPGKKTPEKTGYTLTEPEWPEVYPAEGVTVVIAKWTANSYKVVFHNGSKTAEETGFKYDEAKALTALSVLGDDFKKDGATFLGWATSANGDPVYADAATVKNLTAEANGTADLYAIWSDNTITAKFVANDEVFDSKTGTTGAAIENPGTPDAPEGYEFDGWYDGNTKLVFEGDDAAKFPAKDAVYTAKFKAAKHKVTFAKGAHGDFTNSSEAKEFTDIATGTKLSDVDDFAVPGITADEGFTFTGWKNNADGAVYTAEEILALKMAASDMTFTAQYSEMKAASIVFDYNGGAVGDELNTLYSGRAGESFQGTPEEPEYTGYTFAGWIDSEGHDVDLASLKYPAEGSVTIIKASWTAKNNTVNFEAADGGDVTSPTEALTIASGSAVGVVPEAQPDDTHKFTDMWESSEGGFFTSEEVEDYVISGENSTVTFTAQFTEAGQSLIMYVYNGGLDSSGKAAMMWAGTAHSAFEPGEIPEPERTGYTLSGIEPDMPVEFPEEGTAIRVFAQWTANTYTVEFHNGTEKKQQTGFEYGTAKKLSSVSELGFTKPGCTSLGWATEEGGDPVYSDSATVLNLCTEADGTASLYAVWAQNDITVSFVANDKVFKTETGKTGEAIPDPGTPEAPKGYEFDGWYDGDTKLSFTGEGKVLYPAKDAVYTARFKTTKQGVTFSAGDHGRFTDPDAATSFSNIDTGEKIGTATGFAIPEITANDSYNFIGYECSMGGLYFGDSYGDIADVVMGSESITFTAVYAEKGKTVIYYDFNGGTDEGGNNFAYWTGTAQTAFKETLPDIARPGYTLTAPSVEGLKFPDEGTGATAEVTTITAAWTANSYSVKFHNGDAEADEEDFTYGAAKELTTLSELGDGFTKPGYTFLGWATSDGGKPEYADGAKVKNLTTEAGGTADLYAVWEANDIAAKFVAGDSIFATETGKPGDTLEDPGAPEVPAGYEFDGWYDEDGNKLVFEGDDAAKYPVKDAVYTAKFIPTAHTVSFKEGDHGSFAEGTTTEFDGIVTGAKFSTNEDFSVPEPKVAKGYIFTGYEYVCGDDTRFYPADKLDQIANVKSGPADTTLTAAYVQKKQSQIVFDFGGGTLDDKSYAIVSGTAGTDFSGKAPVPTREGYKADAYSWDKDITKLEFPNEGETLTVKAKWDKNKRTAYDVEYSASVPKGAPNSTKVGKVPGSSKGYVGDVLTLPAGPTINDGYTFIGWAASGALSGTYSAGQKLTLPAGDVRFTAVFAAPTSTEIKNTDPFKLRSNTQTKNSIRLVWDNVPGAACYAVYASPCNTGNKTYKPKFQYKTTENDLNLKKLNGKRLKKGTCYKMYVIALDSNGKQISKSWFIHVTTKAGKYKNQTGVKLMNVKGRKVTLKTGGTFKIKAKSLGKHLKTGHAKLIRYQSSDKKVATVSAKGVIRGVKKGTCKVCVYTINGKYKTILVTVK